MVVADEVAAGVVVVVADVAVVVSLIVVGDCWRHVGGVQLVPDGHDNGFEGWPMIVNHTIMTHKAKSW